MMMMIIMIDHNHPYDNHDCKQIIYYPNYCDDDHGGSPVGPRERDPVLIERSNLVNISKLVVKEVWLDDSFDDQDENDESDEYNKTM